MPKNFQEDKSYIFIPDVAKALEEHNLEFCLDVNQQHHFILL